MRLMKLFFRIYCSYFNQNIVIIKSRLVAGKDLCLHHVILLRDTMFELLSCHNSYYED